MVAVIDRRYPEAAERFGAAVEHQPDYLEARVGLADALRMTGRVQAAPGHYREVVAADPRFADAWAGYVMALAGLGRVDEARDRLGEALSILPGHPQLTGLRAQLR
jgi:Flp pilus assembly protein TadD